MPGPGETQATSPDMWVGQTLGGRYRVDSLLGAGGLGMVYRATHVGLDRPVAIKVLIPDLLPSDSLRERFAREVKTLSRLAHPHIVTLTDSGILDNGAGYLVMELLEGLSLEQRLRKAGAVPPEQAISIARQTLLALAEAHAKDVLHRDIKPGNVFLQPLADGGVHVKLLDFGVAKVRRDVAADPKAYPTLTLDGTVVGTPTYMAPEQAMASAVGPAADVYSVGVVLFEMLAGAPPFRGDSKLEVLRAHLAQAVPKLSSVAPGLTPTPELTAVIEKALAKDRGDRYGTAREMVAALDALPIPAATWAEGKGPEPYFAPIQGTEPTLSVHSSQIVASAPRTSRPASGRRPVAAPAEKSRTGAVLVVGLVLVAAGGLAWKLWPRATPGASSAAEEAPTAPTPDVTHEVAVEEEESEGDPANPFNAGPLPAELRDARQRIFRGRRLSDGQMHDVGKYQREHPEDPRPSLLLARHHRIGSEWSRMVRYYRAAHRIDPDVIGFRPMLPDLLRAVSERSSGFAAVDAVVRIYGRRALPDVERALARRRIPADERRRLERIRTRIAALPPQP